MGIFCWGSYTGRGVLYGTGSVGERVQPYVDTVFVIYTAHGGTKLEPPSRVGTRTNTRDKESG